VCSGRALAVGEEPTPDIGNPRVGDELLQSGHDRVLVESEFLHVGRMADEHVEDTAAHVSGL